MTNLGYLHYFLGLQVLQTKEGIFLSESKYACQLLRRFHMDDSKPTPSPFLYGVKLVATNTSPEFYATLYHPLVGSLLYLTHTSPHIPLLLVLFPSICKDPMKSIGKRLKGYFGMFGVQLSLGYITIQGGLLCWLVSLIQIELVTLMIESLLQVIFSALVLDLSLGLVRNNRHFHFI
jgi:hypothetical protein